MSDSFAGVKSIFGHAMELRSPEERQAYLARSCGDDRRLRAEVESLLQAAQNAGGFLQGQPIALDDTADETPVAERPGTVIGPYKLLEQIGEGGFGVVYIAEQERPVVRKVALKVLKPGMDTKQVVARFEAERQALALMDHPNIAHIHDGGTTAAGRPYFVMELVRGVPITEFCDRDQLAVRERLGLFVQVCQAVQHAHQKGVLHRDLKPSNVLVTLHDGVPVPKVIDFGVAKALGQRLTDKTLFTAFAQMVGTPLYMSPEQAELSGLDVDTRSDVYSLGVLLYELLTGTTPFDGDRMRTAGYDEIRRIIREEEPARPSSRVSTLAQAASTVSENRCSDPRRLSRLLRGELDWVVMKCLEKDRSRRYESAAALAQDIERHLADQPVEACPPSALYRVRKLVRRNKRAMATAAVLAAAALLAAGSFGWASRDRAARRAETDRDNAARQAEADRELDLALEEAGRQRDRGDWPKARAAVERAARLAAGSDSDARRERVRVMEADLQMAARLEEIRLGEPVMTMLVLHRGLLDPVYAGAFRDYGIDVPALDAPTAAELINASGIRAHLVAALDDWLWAKDCQIYSYGTFGWAENRLKVPGFQAEYEHLRAVADLATPDELSRRVRDPEVRKSRKALEQLAGRTDVAGLPPSSVMLLARGLFRVYATNQAVRLLRAAQQRFPDDFLVNFELAALLPDTTPAQREEKLAFMRAAVACRPRYVTLHLRLGRMLLRAQRLDEATAAFRTAFELEPSSKVACADLAKALASQGKQDDALAVHVRYVTLHPEDASGQYALGRAYCRARQWDKAIAALREASRLSPNTIAWLYLPDLAWLLATCPQPSLRDVPQAIEAAEKAVRINPKQAPAWRALGAAQYRAGNWDGAVTALEQANQLRGGETIAGWFFRAMAHWERGEHGEAGTWYDRAVQRMKEQTGIDGDSVEAEEQERLRAEAEERIAGARDRRLRAEDAEQSRRAEADRRRWDKVIADSSNSIKLRPDDVQAWYRRARAYVKRGQFDKALRDYSEAVGRKPDDLELAFDHAAALLLTGDSGTYKQVCARLLERGDALKCEDQPGRKSFLLARVCLLVPDTVADTARLSDLAEEAVKARSKYAFYLHTLGLAHFRAGQDDDAIERLEESMRANPKWSGQPLNWLTLAMAHHRLDHPRLARQWLAKAVRAVEESFPELPEGAPAREAMHSHDFTAWLVLRREAEALINGNSE